MEYPPDAKKRMRTIIKSQVFIFTTEGQYLFRVRLNEGKEGKLVAEIPVEAKLKKIKETKEN